MEAFYKNHNLKKSGDGPGGKFNGPNCKFIVSEEGLIDLENNLLFETAAFIALLRSIKELHDFVCQVSLLKVNGKKPCSILR